jgi:pilus assembly protein CpaF
MSQAALAKREAAWVVRLFNRESYSEEHQELKFTLHRKMLNRVNLEALSALPEQRMREEVRVAVSRLVEEEDSPLSLVEKEQVINEVLDEVFGLGPLEPLLQDRHSGYRA